MDNPCKMMNQIEILNYKCIYKEEYGDLFNNDSTYILVHCISADFAMGAGIAKSMCNIFPNLRANLKEQASRRKYKWNGTGKCILTTSPRYNIEDNVYIIANLITKHRYFMKPTYETLRESLEDLRTQLVIYMNRTPKVDIKLAMPKIGCGLDKLEWDKVSKIIKDVFSDISITILVNL